MNSIKKKTEALLEASKEVCLEVNAEKSKYMVYLATKMKNKIIVY